jgi:formylglycine-generating enzyme required for sulfatase activity
MSLSCIKGTPRSGRSIWNKDGKTGEGNLEFCFDNETPRHRVYLDRFQPANRKITCREFLEFMSNDGYTRPGLWLSDGWDALNI